MYVFYDEQTGNVLSAFTCDPRFLDPEETNFIEVPEQTFSSLAGLRVVNGELVLDNTSSTYQEELRVKINIERDRRIRDTFVFEGKLYGFDSESKARILGASLLASTKLGSPLESSLYWAGNEPFGWIASDNTVVPMTAATCFDFGQAALAHERQLIFKAYTLKSMSPIPSNFVDDTYWS